MEEKGRKRSSQSGFTDMSRSLFLKYIKIYLGICVLVVALMIPVYFSVYSTTKKMIVNDVYSKLESGAIELSNRITRMKVVADILRENEYVAKVAQIQETILPKEYFYMYKAREAVSYDLTLAMESRDQFVIFRDNPVLLSRKWILSDMSYQDYEAYAPKNEEFKSFKSDIFENTQRIQFFPAREFQFEDTGKLNAVVCAVKGPVDNLKSYDTAVVFLTDVKDLERPFDIVPDNQGEFACLTDREGNVLYGMNYEASTLEAEHGFEGRLKQNGQNYTVLKVTAPEYGLSMVMGISDKSIWNRISGVTMLLWVYLAVSVLGMIGFCIFFALQRMRKMGLIFHSLHQEKADLEIKDEYQFINRAIGQLWDENESIKEKITDMQEDVSNSMLERLLQRGVYTSSEKEKIQDYLKWDMEFYCVSRVQGKWEEEEKALESFYFLDVFMEEYFDAIPVSFGVNDRAYVIRMNTQAFPDTREVLEKLRPVAERNEDLRIGISAIGTGLENLNLCYRQAGMALRQLAEIGGVNIGEYRERSYNRTDLSRLNLHRQLYDLILAGEHDAITKLFEKIRRQALQFPCQTEQEMMRLFFEILEPIARVNDEQQDEDEKETLPSYDSGSSMETLLESLKHTACSLCLRLVKQKQESEGGLKEEVLQFLEEHYADSGMCVAYMAEHFGFSEKYFISYFKKLSGMNFSAYLESRRMSQAENYLLETEESVYKIAEAVGYNTVDAFYKSFKKIYGMPPGKWKESHKKR